MVWETFLQNALLFLFGQPNNMMTSALTFIAAGFVLSLMMTYDPPKTKRQILKESLERYIAYAVFLVIAVRIDSLAIDSMMGWEGSSQSLVLLYIIGTQIQKVLQYFRSKGIEVPGFLAGRADQLRGPEDPHAVNPAELQAKVESLKQQIESMQSQPAAEQPTFQAEDNRGGE